MARTCTALLTCTVMCALVCALVSDLKGYRRCAWGGGRENAKLGRMLNRNNGYYPPMIAPGRARSRERRARRPPGRPSIAQTENIATSASCPLASALFCPDCSHKVCAARWVRGSGWTRNTALLFTAAGVQLSSNRTLHSLAMRVQKAHKACEAEPPTDTVDRAAPRPRGAVGPHAGSSPSSGHRPPRVHSTPAATCGLGKTLSQCSTAPGPTEGPHTVVTPAATPPRTPPRPTPPLVMAPHPHTWRASHATPRWHRPSGRRGKWCARLATLACARRRGSRRTRCSTRHPCRGRSAPPRRALRSAADSRRTRGPPTPSSHSH